MTGPDVAQLVEIGLGVVTSLVFVQIAIPGRRPWAVVADSVRRMFWAPHRLLYMGGFFLVVGFNYLYLMLGIDEHCTAKVVAWRGADFAQFIHAHIEGDTVARIQAAVAWLPLTWFLGFAYVVVFPCLVSVAILVFDGLRHRRGLAMVLVGYVLNFLIVLPFYVCVPVRETFVYYQESGLGGPAARMLLDDISPAVMVAYRTMSGVDNCFPSFHTSLTVTMALAAWHGGRRFGALYTFFGAAIVASTVYLGVHWLTDVAAGLMVGVAAYALARRLTRRWAHDGDARPASATAEEACDG